MSNDMPKTYFDSHSEDYAEQIMATQPVFYENSGRLLNAQLPAGGAVLDIGNGGVINYNYSRLARLDCGDLVVSQQAIEKYREIPNIRFFQADVLDLANIPSNCYDAVVVQCVIHHLAGASFSDSCSRVNAAVAECLRVLKPGGKVLVMESTVTGWFERVERFLYPLMQAFFLLCRFGRVYQFSPKSLERLLSQAAGAQLLSSEKVDIGPHIWIMGKRIPTKITPCGVTFFVLEKESY